MGSGVGVGAAVGVVVGIGKGVGVGLNAVRFNTSAPPTCQVAEAATKSPTLIVTSFPA